MLNTPMLRIIAAWGYVKVKAATAYIARYFPSGRARSCWTEIVEGSCCGRGCEWRVWVYYDQALRRYEAARAQGREQQNGAENHEQHGEAHVS